MPACSYKGCTNSSKKKFKMNSFPRNPTQHAKWIKNMGIKDWKYNPGAVLCEAHFEPHMWEKVRVDGTKKLKWNAVPTIFGDRIIKESQTLEINCENMNIGSLQPVIIEGENPVILESSTTSITVPLVKTNKPNCIKMVPHNSSSRKVVQSTLTSILKPQLKTKSNSIPTIRVSKSVLDQLRMASSKTPIIIPAASNILKSKIQFTNTESKDSETSIMQTADITLLNEAEVNSNSELSDSETSAIQTTSINLNQVEGDTNSELSDSETSAIRTTNINLNQVVGNTNSELSDSETSAMQTTNINLNQIEGNTDSELSDLETSAMQTTNINLNQIEGNTDSEFSDFETVTTPTTGIILNQAEAKKLADQRFEVMDKLLLKQLKLNNALRRRLASLNNKLQRLVKEKNASNETFLTDVFTDDQIRALELRHRNPKSTTTWSYKTMMKAIKLKEECMTRGYEELLRQNLPLPSIRTISRWCTARNIPIP